MVLITEELVRKKAEHNECEICTLEELSLHQEDVEKIEHLQNWCKNLEILLLQSNLISKIENVHKLKRLKYLNLAINNIEVIENLERLESLEKLDLTLNFIGNLLSVRTLKFNTKLKDLYLTGNPCTDYEGYRSYVTAVLPQLKTLDNKDISRTERLKAIHDLKNLEENIKIDEEIYKVKREEQRQRLSKPRVEVPDDEYWKQTSENAPEVRVEMSFRTRRGRGLDKKEEKVEKRLVKFFANDGRPLNMNHPKIDFTICYEDPKDIVLDLAIYKYLDTNLIDVDLQPTYVRVTIKEKIFQIALSEEICTDKSTAQRSQITGHLLITMPKLNYKQEFQKYIKKEKIPELSDTEKKERREYLEIGSDRLSELCNLADNNKQTEFIDDPEVPPLE